MSTQEPSATDKQLQKWARERIAARRALVVRVVTFGLGMLVLTPAWIVGEYLSSGGWPQRLSGNGNPGDWSPWIIWVALIWGFYVLLTAVSMHFRRPTSEREVEREIARLVGHN